MFIGGLLGPRNTARGSVRRGSNAHAPGAPQPEALHAHLDLKAMAASTTAATCLSRGKHCAMPAVAPKGPRFHEPARLHVRRQHPVIHTSQQLLDHPTGRPSSCARPTVRAGAKLRCVRCHGLGHPLLDCHRRTRSRNGALDAAGPTLLLLTTGLRAAAWIGLGAPAAVTHMVFESPLLGTGKEKGPCF